MSAGRIPIGTIARMIARPGAQSGAAVILPIVSYAVTTALVLTVAAGTIAFMRDPALTDYAFFAAFAASLLVPPLFTLGGAAARLSTRRRDDRLATLRLLGASGRAVVGMAVLETAAVAMVGALAGVVLYVALMPLVGLVAFGGAPLGALRMWAGPWVVIGAVLAMVAIAVVSALLALGAVRVTPLGVRSRANAPRIPWGLLVLGLTGIIIAVGVGGVIAGVGPAFGAVAFIGVVCFAFALAIVVINLIGAPIVAFVGRRMATRAKTAAALIAGRRLAEDGRGAWRAVSAMSMISFITIVAGAGVAMMSLAGTEDPDAVQFAADIRTGVYVTLVIAFVALAATVGVTQAASVVDQRDLIRALDAIGVPMRVLGRSRRMAVLVPLLLAIGSGAVVAVVLAVPFIGIAVIVAPLSMLTVAISLAAGVAIVMLAVLTTTPIVTSIRRDHATV